MVFAQVLACYFLQDSSWLTIILMAYIFGGTINHSLTLAIHDIGHNTAFGAGVKNAWKNRYFGFVANLPLGVPYSVTFKKYHIGKWKYHFSVTYFSRSPPISRWWRFGHRFADRMGRQFLHERSFETSLALFKPAFLRFSADDSQTEDSHSLRVQGILWPSKRHGNIN